MDRIDVRVLNPYTLGEITKTMVCAARLTQKGHKIKDMRDFMDLYNKPYRPATAEAMAALPHPTIQKFGVINIAIVGASRRFLAQITRHQDCKFMSASLQYSDYGDDADFVVPYNLLGTLEKEVYLDSCRKSMAAYKILTRCGTDHDEAGYAAPQGLRNVLIISATPFQWKHMISQRICRRNTLETRYVMLRCWEALYDLSPELFADAGPFCMNGNCAEGKMTCGDPIARGMTPAEIIEADFPKLVKE